MSPAEVLTDGDYPRLKQHILEETGLNYYADKDRDLANHLAKRIAAAEVANCEAYLALLRSTAGRAESEALIGELTIGETYFFRQAEHFDLLRETILPQLLERNAATRRLRIWSAGCATGAEPYSLSILLKEQFGAALSEWDVTILATDINAAYLQQARAGVFGKWALRDLGDQQKQRCFDARGAAWEIKPQFRQGVHFQQHNLTRNLPPSSESGGFDLILCRNVLIYFSREGIRQVADRLHDALKPGGWLLVGHAEPSSDLFSRFNLVFAPAVTAYRRPEGDEIPQTSYPEWTMPEMLPTEEPSWTAAAEKHVRTSAGPSPIARPQPQVKTVEPIEEVRRLADRGEWRQAEKRCRDLIEARPVDARAHFTLGLILEHQPGSAEAGSAFRRAVYLDRSLALGHYHLGRIYAEAGDQARARKSFENVLTLIEARPANELVPFGDGMVVAELRDLGIMHLELLRGN